MNCNPDESELRCWMNVAIDSLRLGTSEGQSPFGAAIFRHDGVLVVAEHNQVKRLRDPSAHAEVMAIRAASHALQTSDLSEVCLVSTCEPCPMCTATIILAGIRCVVYGATVQDAIDAGFSELQIPSQPLFDRASFPIELTGEVCREECRELLLQYRSK